MTERIHKAQKEKYSIERRHVKEDVIPTVIRKHHAAQRLLEKVIIVNPFRLYLKFPVVNIRARRDFERFIDLIAGVCFVRQFRKERKNDGRFTFIECDLFDYRIAYEIMTKNVLPATMCEIPKSTLDLYEALRKIAKELSNKNDLKVNEVTFT